MPTSVIKKRESLSRNDAILGSGSDESDVLVDGLMYRLICKLEKVAMSIAITAAVIVMITASYDAITRYLFNSPLSWGFEFIAYYMLVVIPYFSLSATYSAGDHLRFDLVHQKLPSGLRRFTDLVSSLATAIVFAIIAYSAWTHLVEAYETNAFIPGVIMWPVWLFYLPIVIGAGVFVLRLIAECCSLVWVMMPSQKKIKKDK